MFISELAVEVVRDWKKVSIHAKPYLDAMIYLRDKNSKFGCDSAEDIVLRFLCNATSWRGETARRVKQQLKDAIK